MYYNYSAIPGILSLHIIPIVFIDLTANTTKFHFKEMYLKKVDSSEVLLTLN
jgi:hypothetical protein